MFATVFNAKKTRSKYPASPYEDDTFYFETRQIDSIIEVFESLVSNFTLCIPLTKNIKSLRRYSELKQIIQPYLDYLIIDIDDIDKISDRALCLDWFKRSGYEVVLGESRTDYRIKGVMRCEKMSQKEAKLVLKEIQDHIPGVVDLSAVSRAAYQAPILKHKILFHGGTKKYPIPNTPVVIPTEVSVPNQIEQICINELNKKGFSFDNLIDGGYKCSHPSEVKSKGDFTWNRAYPFVCTHWNSVRNISVWNEVIKTPEYREYQSNQSVSQVKNLLPKNGFNVDDRYLSNNQKTVQEFIDNTDMLRIQSPMGTAKSKVIEEVIHQARKQKLRILFLTNRISLADDITQKYEGLKHYLGTEMEGNNYELGDDLVVQIDSLHKFSTKAFDLVVIDEFTTTMMHILSLEYHKKKIATQIFALKNRKLVIADAFIFDDLVDLFQPKTQTKIINKYRDKVEIELFKQKDKFIFELIEKSKKEPVTFSCGSTQILKVTKLLLDQHNISNLTISAETPKEIKKAIFASFKNKTPKAQVIMYSPSLTVGISNENKVSTHFHFDSGMSMDVLSSLQMIKRTRQATKINIFLDERIKYQKTDLFQIQQYLTDFKQQDQDGDDIGISSAGTKLAKIIQLHNTLENRHRISFLALLGLQFDLSKTKINNTRIPPFIIKTSKIVKDNETKEKFQIFDLYKTLSSEKISDIEMKVFAVNKKELYVREFEKIKSDETFKLSDSKLELLIKEEIRTPGTVDSYRLQLANKIYKLDRRGTLSKKDIINHKYTTQLLKDHGYKRKKHLWVLNSTLNKLLKEK